MTRPRKNRRRALSLGERELVKEILGQVLDLEIQHRARFLTRFPEDAVLREVRSLLRHENDEGLDGLHRRLLEEYPGLARRIELIRGGEPPLESGRRTENGR